MEPKIIPILMYHSIQDVDKYEIMRSLHVKPKAFATHMRILRALGYRGCSVSEALDAFETKSQERLVAISFDDGYQNFFTNALPTLIKHGFSATVYPVVDYIGEYNHWDVKTGISRNALMTQTELHSCLESGIELGCHSATHKSLKQKNVDLSKEITESKIRLETLLNTNITSFCYPYGHVNEKAVDTIKNSGYRSATTMIRSRANATDDPLLLPRIPVTWHTLPHLFLAKILTAYEDRRRHA